METRQALRIAYSAMTDAADYIGNDHQCNDCETLMCTASYRVFTLECAMRDVQQAYNELVAAEDHRARSAGPAGRALGGGE